MIFMSKNVIVQIGDMVVKVPKKGLKKALHQTHKVGSFLKGLL